MSKVTKELRATGVPQTLLCGKGNDIKLVTVIPMRIVRHRYGKVIIHPGQTRGTPNSATGQSTVDGHLIKALARAVYWQELLNTGRVANIAELAQAEGIDKVRVQKTLKMAMLSPRLAEQIASGKGPVGLSFEFFVRKMLPGEWSEQELLMARRTACHRG